MKNLFLVSIIPSVLFFTYSCKRCYTCVNQCTTCNGFRYDTSGYVIDTLTLDTVGITFDTVPVIDNFCSDDSLIHSLSEYNARIAADTAAGFVCAQAASGISYDYCVNKPGDEQHYMDYYDKNGRMICTKK